jgi:thiol-disulfide isomerase/thioredoxin
MKKAIACLGILFFSLLSYSQGVQFEDGKWETILEMAKAQNKIIFVDTYTDWCKPCKFMDQNVFPLEVVGKFFNENFINVKMDMEKGEGIEIKKRYKINGYPTWLFVDYIGTVVHRDAGGKPADVFLEVGKRAVDPSRNLMGMNKKYNSGEHSQEFLRDYIPVLGHGDQKKQQKEIFDDYYNSIPKAKLFNKKDFEVIMSVVDMDDPAFMFVLKNHQKYKEVVDENYYDQKVYGKLIVPFSRLIFDGKVKEMIGNAEKFKPYYPAGVQLAEDMAMLRFYRENKIAPELYEACVDFVENHAKDNPAQIIYCMKYIIDGEDVGRDIYKEALNLVKNAYDKFPENFNLGDVYAALLMKSGQRGLAKTEAKRILEMAPENKKNNLWSYKFLKESQKKLN